MNRLQISLFGETPPPPTSADADYSIGRENRDNGIKQAIDHAKQEDVLWPGKAYLMLKRYLSFNIGEFMGEDIRKYSEANGLPEPPSKRAWGAIMVKAAKAGLITKVGTRSVKNPKAHMANATLWIKNGSVFY